MLVNGASPFPITCTGVRHQRRMALHVQDIHTNSKSEVYPVCGHLEGDAKNRLWLPPGIRNTRVFPN